MSGRVRYNEVSRTDQIKQGLVAFARNIVSSVKNGYSATQESLGAELDPALIRANEESLNYLERLTTDLQDEIFSDLVGDRSTGPKFDMYNIDSIKGYIRSKIPLFTFNRDLPFGRLSLLEKMEKMMESKVS